MQTCCPNCGENYWTIDGTVDHCFRCGYDRIESAKNRLTRENNAPTGWICPVCGSGVSPYKDSCPDCRRWDVTCY